MSQLYQTYHDLFKIHYILIDIGNFLVLSVSRNIAGHDVISKKAYQLYGAYHNLFKIHYMYINLYWRLPCLKHIKEYCWPQCVFQNKHISFIKSIKLFLKFTIFINRYWVFFFSSVSRNTTGHYVFSNKLYLLYHVFFLKIYPISISLFHLKCIKEYCWPKGNWKKCIGCIKPI